jgi:hypothetical protein
VNILFLSTWYPYPPDNGSKIRVYHLLRALRGKHRVHLVAFAFGTAEPGETRKLSELCESVDVVRKDPHSRGRVAEAFRFFSPDPLVTRPIHEMTNLVTEVRKGSDRTSSSHRQGDGYRALGEGGKCGSGEHNSSSRQMWERYRRQSSDRQASLLGKLRRREPIVAHDCRFRPLYDGIRTG